MPEEHKSYKVKLTESEIYVVEVEATNHEEAYDKAWEKLDSDPDNKFDYHHDSEQNESIIE